MFKHHAPVLWAGICALIVLGTGGCGRNSATVTLAGSTAFQPFAEKLADQYMATHPDAVISVQGGGSALGIQSTLAGTASIGMADLVKLPPEAQSLHPTVVAQDGIALVVHPGNPIQNLTLDQIRDVFNGKLVNWNELGGTDHAITVVSREAGSGTRSSFEQIVGGIQLTHNAIIQDSNGTIRETVANDPYALGYLSHGLVDPSKIKALQVDGAECTPDEIKAKRYPLVRPIYLLTRDEPQGVARTFIDYILSTEGQAMILKDGLLPAR